MCCEMYVTVPSPDWSSQCTFPVCHNHWQPHDKVHPQTPARDSTIIIKITHTQTEGYRVFLYNSAPTWQFLQQRPSLHLAPWVNIHFMQQFSPSLAHSCRKTEKKTDYISSVRLMWSWCWCKITHGWASTVTLLSCLHKTISTLWRIQELQNRKVLCYFAHFYLFINCTIIIIIHTYDLFSYVMSKRL